jgi:Flp pilus assembly protein TadG
MLYTAGAPLDSDAPTATPRGTWPLGPRTSRRMRRRAWRLPRRFRRDQRGQAIIVEFVIGFMLLIGVIGGFASYMTAAHARAVLISAVDAAGRDLAAGCDPYSTAAYGTAQADAQLAFLTVLRRGGLEPWSAGLVQTPATPGEPHSYTLQTTCVTGSGVATVSATYEAVDVFPVLGAVLHAGPSNRDGTIQIETGAEFPVE